MINTQSRSLRVYVLTALGVALTWQVLTRSLAAYLAADAPEAALLLRSTEPVANVTLADRLLNRRPGAVQAAGEAAQTQKVYDDVAQQGDHGLAGWAETALKATAQELPLERRDDAPTVAPAAPPIEREREEIRAHAVTSLVNDPLNARALRILGQLADAAGDEPAAFGLMHAAVGRSLAESFAVYWMMRKSFEKKDYAGTVYYADVFLRKRPQLTAYAIPILAQMAEGGDQKAVGAVKSLLADNPPWRSSFFDDLPLGVTDARTPLNLLLSVKDTPTPPDPVTVNNYVTFLLNNKFYELAYYTWLQFLPASDLGRAGFLANASFKKPPSGSPFDWKITSGAGVTVDIVPRPDNTDQHALFLELGPGRVDFSGVTHMTLLSAGTYTFMGKIKGELSGRRGLQWSMRCADVSAPTTLGESKMFVGSAASWADFQFTFTVPDKNCRAQVLRLDLAARSASEQLVSGSVWYDDLKMSRAEDVATPNAVPATEFAPRDDEKAADAQKR